MLYKIGKKLQNLIKIFKLLVKKQYFGFNQGHYFLNDSQLREIGKLVGITNAEGAEIVAQFEKEFSGLIGEGSSISFASARMAFYSLMKQLGITKGDEVILQAANCSVMASAVLRIGATPIFADFDPDTFGSSLKCIKQRVNNKTKMIVAQHSFGIPCRIEEIADYAKENNIFLLEDCALTLGAAINGKLVGNWGNAAIFSTDKSKPINTFIGGLLYTRNTHLLSELKVYRDSLPQLSEKHQKAIFREIRFEKVYYCPDKYGSVFFIKYVRKLLNVIGFLKHTSPQLSDDYTGTIPFSPAYPYPAKMPCFLAMVGLFEIERWYDESKRRKKLLSEYITIFKKKKIMHLLPRAYMDQALEIVPLRFAFIHLEANKFRKVASNRFDTEAYWFLKPIVACLEPKELGYVYGSCHEVERATDLIINFPCIIKHEFEEALIQRVIECFNKLER